MQKKYSQRIWELDALRGTCILGMIIIHALFDLAYFWDMDIRFPVWVMVISQGLRILFILISGCCATLSANSFKRGVYVFACGLLISYVTIFAEVFLSLSGIRIWFGILHMLGISMILYPLFRKLPTLLLVIFGLCLVGLGIWLNTLSVSVPWLFPLGLRAENVYIGSDYFPLLPNFGWFLMGSALGKAIYHNKESRLPDIHNGFRWLCFIGRHSLIIYLLHQPLIMAMFYLLFS